MSQYVGSYHWSHPARRRRVKDIVVDLSISEYRQYLGDFYAEPQQLSDTTILRMMHEWRLAIYLESQGVSKSNFVVSLRWLSEYYN